MSYTPSPTDFTQPTEDKFVETAAAEFRTLKQYIQQNLLTSVIRLQSPDVFYTSLVKSQLAGKLLGFDLVSSEPIPVTISPGDGTALATALASQSGSSLVGFIPFGTGAFARTVEDKLHDESSVFDFALGPAKAAIRAGTYDAGVTTAWQLALDSGVDAFYPNNGSSFIDKTLLIKNGTPRVAIKGNHRIRSILQPQSVSIATAPELVNALFFNKDNNSHFCLENMRMTGINGYTGVGIYAKELGGADGSGQCLFSGIGRNLWIDFGSSNNGFFVGGTQNFIWDAVTFENMKVLFNLQGIGNGDNFRKNFSVVSGFDQVILQTTDTNGSFAESVGSVHVYNHMRGLAFDLQNWIGGTFDDIYYEAATGNLGGTGIGRFKSCTGTMLSKLYALARAGVPACAIGLEFDTFIGKVHQGFINGTIGVRLSGTGTMSLDMVDMDFTDCVTACMQFFGNITGAVRTTRCKFNRSQGYGVVFQVSASCDWYSTDDEFLDAGLGGNVAFRNLSLATNGKVVLTRPKLGLTTGAAVAQYWIAAVGTGTVDIYDPQYVGTPPSAVIDPGSTQAVNIHLTQASGSRAVTVAADTVLAGDYNILGNRAGTITETLPTPGSCIGRELCILTQQAQAIVSASANVIPLAGGAAGTAILPATLGKWVIMNSTGTAWQITKGN